MFTFNMVFQYFYPLQPIHSPFFPLSFEPLSFYIPLYSIFLQFIVFAYVNVFLWFLSKTNCFYFYPIFSFAYVNIWFHCFAISVGGFHWNGLFLNSFHLALYFIPFVKCLSLLVFLMSTFHSTSFSCLCWFFSMHS